MWVLFLLSSSAERSDRDLLDLLAPVAAAAVGVGMGVTKGVDGSEEGVFGREGSTDGDAPAVRGCCCCCCCWPNCRGAREMNRGTDPPPLAVTRTIAPRPEPLVPATRIRLEATEAGRVIDDVDEEGEEEDELDSGEDGGVIIAGCWREDAPGWFGACAEAADRAVTSLRA